MISLSRGRRGDPQDLVVVLLEPLTLGRHLTPAPGPWPGGAPGPASGSRPAAPRRPRPARTRPPAASGVGHGVVDRRVEGHPGLVDPLETLLGQGVEQLGPGLVEGLGLGRPSAPAGGQVGPGQVEGVEDRAGACPPGRRRPGPTAPLAGAAPACGSSRSRPGAAGAADRYSSRSGGQRGGVVEDPDRSRCRHRRLEVARGTGGTPTAMPSSTASGMSSVPGRSRRSRCPAARISRKSGVGARSGHEARRRSRRRPPRRRTRRRDRRDPSSAPADGASAEAWDACS